MEAFVKKQVFYNPRVFLEKTLPKEGEILVKVGDRVKPFDVLGFTYVSLTRQRLSVPKDGKILVAEGEKVSYNQPLVKIRRFLGSHEIKSPIPGTVNLLSKAELEIISEPEKYNLISGIEAEAVKIVPRLSVLLKSEATVVRGVWACGQEKAGEVKILKATNEELRTSDLSADDFGKILVFPGALSDAVLKKAKMVGVAGIVCASVESGSKSCQTNLLLTEGFGTAFMTKELADFLATVAVRTAVISPQRRQLLVPGLALDRSVLDEEYPARAEIVKGSRVQILNWPYFGQVGRVSEILESYKFESGLIEPALSVTLENKEEVWVPAVNVLILSGNSV
ncbi:MAG: hypothetical protein M1352_02010 [Patescibacteria group bacterium]|nr:hypothetical protein [Patescibacteria group bacterium]